MKKYIRVVNNTVAEIIEVPDTSDIKSLYHPDIVSHFQLSTNNVQVGYILENGVWVEPPVIEPPPLPKPPEQPQIPPSN